MTSGNKPVVEKDTTNCFAYASCRLRNLPRQEGRCPSPCSHYASSTIEYCERVGIVLDIEYLSKRGKIYLEAG